MRGPVTVGFVARAALVVLGIWALALMLWFGHEILFVAFFGCLFALFLSIFVEPLVRRGVPRGLAVLLVVLALIGLVFFLFWLIWPTLQAQTALVINELPNAISNVVAWIRAEYAALTGRVSAPGAGVSNELQPQVERFLARIVAGTLPFLQTTSSVIVGAFLIFITGIYLVAEPGRYLRGLVSLVPPEGRERFRRALNAVGSDLRGWILGTAINMVIIGVLTTIGLLFLGVPAALVLGLIALILEFIPFYGPILSALPAIAVALLTSPTLALWVALLYLGIQQSEGHLISPLVMRGVVRLPPALTVLIGAFMAILFGFLGLILAVPSLATALVLFRRLYVKPLNARALRSLTAPPDTPPAAGD